MLAIKASRYACKNAVMPSRASSTPTGDLSDPATRYACKNTVMPSRASSTPTEDLSDPATRYACKNAVMPSRASSTPTGDLSDPAPPPHACCKYQRQSCSPTSPINCRYSAFFTARYTFKNSDPNASFAHAEPSSARKVVSQSVGSISVAWA